MCRWALWNEEHLQRGLKSSASVSSSYPPKSSVLFTLCPLQFCQREFQLCLKCMRLSVLSHHLPLKPSYSYLIIKKWNLWRYFSPLCYSLVHWWITNRIIMETSNPSFEQRGRTKNKVITLKRYSHAGLSWCRHRWSDKYYAESAHNCTSRSFRFLPKHLRRIHTAKDDKKT